VVFLHVADFVWSRILRAGPAGIRSPRPATLRGTARPVSPPSTQDWSIPSDDELRAFLAKRMEYNGVGVVIGVIEPAGRRVVAYGRSGNPDGRALDGDTMFLLGSVSKSFVGLVFADMIRRGEVKLDDPASKFLPPGVKMPQRGRPITLADLSTHTSGLPAWPTNINMLAEPDPVEAYTLQNLYHFLSTYTPSREPGGVPQYSNLGVALLGRLLGLRVGKEYNELLKGRVLQPLGMDSTAFQLSPVQLKRLALGHDKDLQPTYTAETKTLYPSGALRSSANDLLKYLAANLGYVDTPLEGAMLYQRSAVRFTRGSDPSEVALGWLVRRVRGHEIFYHDGGKQGYRSVIAFDPERRLGVVVLSNSRWDESLPAWSRYLLTGEPLPPPPPPYAVRKFVSIDPFALDSYAGEYRLAKEGTVINVVRRRDYLLVDDTSGSPAEMFAETLLDFGTRVEKLQISFRTDENGKVTGLTWYPRGKAAGHSEDASRVR
jgi:D-alanyl-D-alanine-carboxypeptidase/D-alanyl-D-alanine-endopeptidase